jgi:Domain of unknown function (DUF4160)
MPIVFRRDGYRFFFFSNEGDPQEPMHVHVRKGGDEAKFWLRPEVAVADSFGFNAAELNALIKVVRRERLRIERAWNEHFGH